MSGGDYYKTPELMRIVAEERYRERWAVLSEANRIGMDIMLSGTMEEAYGMPVTMAHLLEWCAWHDMTLPSVTRDGFVGLNEWEQDYLNWLRDEMAAGRLWYREQEGGA